MVTRMAVDIRTQTDTLAEVEADTALPPMAMVVATVALVETRCHS
jgi:hypothetical protein